MKGDLYMNDIKFNKVFNEFTRDINFALPVMQQNGDDYKSKLKNIYSNYNSLLDKWDGSEELIASAKTLCNSIERILDSNQEEQWEIMDKILESYLDEASSNDLMIYRKKSICGLLDRSVFHSEEKDRDLLYLYRSTNRVNDINDEHTEEGKLQQMFHCPYNLLQHVSSTRYSMKGVPSLYMATSMSLSFSELKGLKPGDEVYISKFRINRNPTEKINQINVLEFGIVPSDFNKTQLHYEEEKNLPINKYPVFKNQLLKIPEIKKSYLLWYPLFAACSFIRKKDSGEGNSLEYPEYVIPQLFLTRLNEKSASTGLLYGIRYFSCADEKSYLKGFNYVFPCGEAVDDISRSKLKFSEKLVDSFTLTPPKIYRVSSCERDLDYKLKHDDDISIEDWEQFFKDGNLDENKFKRELEIHESWSGFIHKNKEIIKVVIDQIKTNEQLTPKNPRKIFRFLTQDISKVKVVILGQDPYAQKNVATGRAFEVSGINNWEDLISNTSLLNILKSIYNNYNNMKLTKCQLRDEIHEHRFAILPPELWFNSMENQGVLFLNSFFTCDIGKRSSQKKTHKKIWIEFSCKLLEEIDSKNNKIKWFIWGNSANELVSKCNIKGKKYFSYHPSASHGGISNIVCFNWSGIAREINWLGETEQGKVEQDLEKSNYSSINNEKIDKN